MCKYRIKFWGPQLYLLIMPPKKGRSQKTPPLQIGNIEFKNASANINHYCNGSAETTSQNELGGLDEVNARGFTVNQNNLLIGPTETADQYFNLGNLNAVLQNKTAKDIFVIHFNAVS